MGPWIFGPKRYVDPAVDLNEIPEVNLFLLTHNHYDHLDHEKFWEWCRYMAKNNILFISEYKAPRDFELIWSIKSQTTAHSMTEKLFVLF